MKSALPRAGRIFIHESESFAAAAAKTIARHITAAIDRRGYCALALAGGGTPRPVYERLALGPLAETVAWDRVAIYFGDERCVPPDDPESNYRMAAVALLRHVPIPSASIHRMEGEQTDHDAAAREYAQLLPESLDVLLLGMGEDGHTASLFPRSPVLAERLRRVVAVYGPVQPRCRLTITAPVIHAAETVIVLVAGAGKADALARALEGSYLPDELPIQLALGGTWIIDRDAAQALQEEPRSGRAP